MPASSLPPTPSIPAQKEAPRATLRTVNHVSHGGVRRNDRMLHLVHDPLCDKLSLDWDLANQSMTQKAKVYSPHPPFLLQLRRDFGKVRVFGLPWGHCSLPTLEGGKAGHWWLVVWPGLGGGDNSNDGRRRCRVGGKKVERGKQEEGWRKKKMRR